MTLMNPDELMAQLDEVEASLTNLVDEEQVAVARRALTVNDTAMKLAERLKRAGVMSQDRLDDLKEQRTRLEKFVREFG